MPKAKTREARARQVLRWIAHEWPIGRPVRLEWVEWILDDAGRPTRCYGQTYRDGRELVIEVSSRINRTTVEAVDTTIHEAAHAILWPQARVEWQTADHPPAFWAQYGEIRDRFDHDHGAEQADEF